MSPINILATIILGCIAFGVVCAMIGVLYNVGRAVLDSLLAYKPTEVPEPKQINGVWWDGENWRKYKP